MTATSRDAVDVFRPPPPQAATIPGPAGALEARIEDPTPAGTPVRRIGVVCHPHPLYGGTMQNKVVHTTARAMQETGAATVRFNFRGVGQSGGQYAAGDGEVEDALAVIAWARERFRCEHLWLAGFSFGAAVALQAAVRGTRPRRLVTIAPPVGRIVVEPVARPDCPWLIVQGDCDELVDVNAVRSWAAGYAPPPDLVVVPDAVHFFHGKLLDLRAAVLQFVQRDKPRNPAPRSR
jgi:alpha/beta superfamily hydrolase